MALAIREAYGAALVECGRKNTDIVVLDADVSSSTKSGMFGKVFPERFFNVGVAEANMCAMACGLASAGKIPFVNTFATFLTSNGLLSMRALGSYNNLNIKCMGAYGGLSDSYDGPTHHSLDDLAVTTALPNFTVCVASDERSTSFLVNAAVDTKGPFYIRLSREALPDLYKEGTTFQLGKANRLRAGRDATILACGIMTSKALEAAETLAGEGVDVGVLDFLTIKPMDAQAVLEAAKAGALVVAEEHNRYGGLGAAVSQVLAGAGIAVAMEHVALQDCHTESGAYDALLNKYGLSTTDVANACRRAVSKKR